MSLDWDTTKCDPPHPVDQDDARMREALIWTTVGVDLGSITEKNVDEWVWRLWHGHKIGLGYFHIREGTTPYQLETWVRRWVGLVCNVVSKPRKEWLKRVSEVMSTRTTEDLQYYQRKKEAEHAESSAKVGRVGDVPQASEVGGE